MIIDDDAWLGRLERAGMWRLLSCVAAVGLLTLFAAAVLGMSWAIADGPAGVRGWALILVFIVAGLVVMGLWTALLLVNTGGRPVGMAVTLAAGIVALFFVGTVPAWFSEWLLHERGRVTTCKVVAVTEEESFNGSGTFSLHRLACDGGGPATLSPSDRTLRVNQRVRVRHDPAGKSDKAVLADDAEATKPQNVAWFAGIELGLITLASLVLIVTGRTDP
ncbi:hypothetical protein [Actinomadura sp. 9N407]|uniref:hypothetical protein n=1 Tax=Actinomadura sp. 9N407 TaxID=3375154 RepID=UPI0037B4D6C4